MKKDERKDEISEDLCFTCKDEGHLHVGELQLSLVGSNSLGFFMVSFNAVVSFEFL